MHGNPAVRAALLAVVFIAGLTIVTVFFWALALGLPSVANVLRQQGPHIVATSCATVFVYACLRVVLRNKHLFASTIMLFVIVASLGMALDLTFLNYFGARFLELRPFLPVGANGLPRAEILASYSKYVTLPLLAGAAAPLALSAVLYSRIRTVHLVVGVIAAVCFGLSFGANRILTSRANSAAIPHPIADLIDTAGVPLRPLTRASRADSFERRSEALLKPRTILLVINESIGHDLPSSEGDKPLREKVAEISGAPERWHIFGNAVTNSNATDVSIPSIVTGSGTHESFEKLHAMPLLFDLAKSRGYHTALITSSVMSWANFDQFFRDTAIDRLYSAEVSGEPIINDLTIDDAFPFRTLADLVAGSETDLFIVLYVNALHVPYQPSSAFLIPSSLQDRRSRALHILESGYRLLFKALRDSGRFDDALLMIVGNHGEFEFRVNPGAFAGFRLESYSDTILSPIFMVKPSDKLPAEMQAALGANAHQLVANLDIAPSIAHLLGVRPNLPLSYAGYSLFAPVPEDRISFAVSTTEWRNWRRTAFAVARQRQRLVCTSLQLCEMRALGSVSGTKDPAQIMEHDLMRKALAEPVVLQSLVKVYRDHFAGARR